MPPSNPSLANLFAIFWNGIGGPLRRLLTWLLHAKYIHGVTGVIGDDSGRILLLKHRFWQDQRWGLPGGLASYGETLSATLRRELLEETGLDVRPSRLLRVQTTNGRLAEFILLAESQGIPVPKSAEIMEARFWDPAALPENLHPAHRALIKNLPALLASPGLPLED